MFYTQFNRKKENVFSKVGNTTLSTPVYDEHGVIVEYDVVDLDGLIQSNKDNGNVALILDRYAVTGDDSYLNATSGFYGDVSDVQNITIHERYEKSQIATDLYDSMPDSIKEMYGSAEEFYQNIDDSKISSILNGSSIVDDVSQVIESEVNEVE